MDAFAVQSLLRAVRRRLWQRQFVAAARWALWGSAGFMLIAVVVHLAARPVSIGNVLVGVGMLWASTMAWAGMRRPSEADGALWADRHLDGASAYSTLLELRAEEAAARPTEAVRWLEQWATASVPNAQRLLAHRREARRLARPLLTMLATAALAALVLTLPGPGPFTRLERAASPASGVADRANASGESLASTGITSELATALQTTGQRKAPDAGGVGHTPAAGSGKNDERNASPIAARTQVIASGGQAAAAESLPGDTVDGVPASAREAAPGAGSGRDAGDSRDDRADAGVSRALPGTSSAPPNEPTSRHSKTGWRADMGQQATFDDDFTTRPAARASAEPVPAATPPPAARTARLSPTEAAYVQAWMTTNPER